MLKIATYQRLERLTFYRLRLQCGVMSYLFFAALYFNIPAIEVLPMRTILYHFLLWYGRIVFFIIII